MVISASYPYCIATVVTSKAIEAMLEAGGEGNYKDTHPWLIAKEFFEKAQADGALLPILFASMNDDNHAMIDFSHWSTIDEIEVVELHRATWDTRCHFNTLRTMNPIFEPIDSVFLKASDEQMARERLEGIRVSRTALDEHHIHPYAICETPAFILESLAAVDKGDI
ncbi:MAG: hypothetical protein GKR90_05260 [Pseudomonadales bacterium]|nr:hypothetical protein [Pseudomonadales bacterium]